MRPPSKMPSPPRHAETMSGVWMWQNVFRKETCPMLPTTKVGKANRLLPRHHQAKANTKAGWPMRNSFVRGRTGSRWSNRARNFNSSGLTPTAASLPVRMSITANTAKATMVNSKML